MGRHGENVGGRHVGYGDGVYRSATAGRAGSASGSRSRSTSARSSSIRATRHVVYVAAQGPLWSPGGERGLYKTTDGGELVVAKVLGGGEFTG